MHIKSCPSRACPWLHENKMEPVYSWAVTRSSTLAHIVTFTVVLESVLLHSSSLQLSFSSLARLLFFLFAPSACAFFMAAAVITPKNLMIIASQSNQSHNIPIERRATAWRDTLWSRKTNQEGGGGVIYPSLGSTTQGIIQRCLTPVAKFIIFTQIFGASMGKQG